MFEYLHLSLHPVTVAFLQHHNTAQQRLKPLISPSTILGHTQTFIIHFNTGFIPNSLTLGGQTSRNPLLHLIEIRSSQQADAYMGESAGGYG